MADFNKHLINAKNEGHRAVRIEIDNRFMLSVIFSAYGYCKPRLNLDDIMLYTHFEIGLLDKFNGKKLTQPRKINKINKCLWIENFEPGESSVAGYVEKQLVVTIINDIRGT